MGVTHTEDASTGEKDAKSEEGGEESSSSQAQAETHKES